MQNDAHPLTPSLLVQFTFWNAVHDDTSGGQPCIMYMMGPMAQVMGPSPDPLSSLQSSFGPTLRYQIQQE